MLFFLFKVILVLNPLFHEIDLLIQLLVFEEFLVVLMGIWYADTVHL